MPDYLLDTNVIIELLRNNPRVLTRMRAAIGLGRDVQINALSYYETRRGLLNTPRADKFDAFCQTFGIVYFDRVMLDRASEVYADLKKKGQLIEDADILIAYMALVHDAVIVTDNIRHFKRVVGLKLENWVR